MQTLRRLLSKKGHYSSRRTWERRLNALPQTLPAQIGVLAQSRASPHRSLLQLPRRVYAASDPNRSDTRPCTERNSHGPTCHRSNLDARRARHDEAAASRHHIILCTARLHPPCHRLPAGRHHLSGYLPALRRLFPPLPLWRAA